MQGSPPCDYMSDGERGADELTKQIASSLLHGNPLSDEEDVLDNDCLNNLASSLTPNDLNSISQVRDLEYEIAVTGSRFEIKSNFLSLGSGRFLSWA